MMRKWTKWTALCLALVLAGVCALGAFSEKGPIREVYDAGMALMFDTPNVTLTADVSVARDGKLFKTVKATYVQDGQNDDIDAHFYTVRPNGTSYESFWRVRGVDGYAYSMDSMGAPYYSTYSHESEASVMDKSIPVYPLLSFGSSVMGMADLLFPNAAVREDNVIRVRFDGKDSPEALNDLAEQMVRYAAMRFMGLNVEMHPDDPAPAEEIRTLWQDVDKAFAVGYEKLYGEPFDDEGFYYGEWSEEKEERSTAVWNEWNARIAEAADGRTDGCVCILADGTVIYTDSYAEGLRAIGEHDLYYDDIEETFLVYLKERTGDAWDMRTLNAAFASSNGKLWDRVNALWEDMSRHYEEALGDAPMGLVRRDGTLEIVEDPDRFEQEWNMGGHFSIAYMSLTRMVDVRIGETDVAFTLDSEGRVIGAEGTVNLIFVGEHGREETITVTLKLGASEFGSSRVEAFDPEEWGVKSFSEWLKSGGNDEVMQTPEPLPSKVTLEGVEYELDP